MSADSVDTSTAPTRKAQLSTIAAYHDQLAGHPDLARRVGWRGRADQLLRFEACLAALPATAVTSVLDVGCGNGGLAGYLRQCGFEGTYLGIEALPGMVADARAHLPDERFMLADLRNAHGLAEQRFDLVVACGTLSLRVPDYDGFANELLQAMWRHTEKALAVVLPSRRARRHLAGAASSADPFVYHSPPELRRRLVACSAATVVRDDFLPTDLAGYAYRHASVLHASLERQGVLAPEEMAWLYLTRGLAADALRVLDAHGPTADPTWWVRRGQALSKLGSLAQARQAFERALELDPDHDEAKLEVQSLL